MKELLQNIWIILKAAITERLPIIKNADLGPLGTLKDTWAIIAAIAGGILFIIKFLKKRS